MEKDTKTLSLIIIEQSANDTEHLLSQLRNAGYAVRAHTPEDENQLAEILDQQPIDLAFVSSEAESPGLHEVLAAVKERRQDIPVIAVSADFDGDKLAEMMIFGSTDMVSHDNPDHLQMVVRREVTNLRARQRVDIMEKTLREAEKRSHRLLESSRDAITYVHDGMHVYANPVYLEMFGFEDAEDIEGTPILDRVAPDDHDRIKDFLRNYNQTESDTQDLEIQCLHPDGNTFNALMEFSPASFEGEPCSQIIIRDKSDHKELEKKLKFLSKQDLLTGLYNRQYFLEELSQAVTHATTDGDISCVLYLVPDNFKDVREQVGIAGADRVLTELGKIVKESIDDKDIAARFSDISFSVLSHLSETNEIMELAEKIRTAVENHICEVDGRSVTVTVSIGISLVSEAAENTQSILSHADLACEMARNQGGNKVHLHNPIADQKASKERDAQWVNLIKQAIEEDRFILVYQPIASLHGHTGEKYEVLLRMKDHDDHEVMPNQFIPVAESKGLITAVDRWVISRAINVLAERRRGGKDTIFFVKVSGDTLSEEDLLPWLSDELKKAKLPGDTLVFEMAENAATTHLKQAKLFIKGLEKLKCKFSIEHFGSGNNSFQLLKHLPADYLKVDGSFMHNLAGNQDNQALVKSIAEMAQSMGKQTIAHHVEDASSLAVLWQCGVNFIQGHFLQEPNHAMNYDFENEESEEA